MKRFFNLIPGKDSCCILLYGDIGDYYDIRSADIARELMEAAATYKKIDVRINSNGGDVYSGIALFNVFRSIEADITIYVDGIAASIASAIALCGKPVKMSRYARLMLHSISGGCYGNRSDLQDCIRQLESLEDTLCDMYAKRCKKTKEEVRVAYFDEKDHWLTADEALALGFIDEIYDTDPVPQDSTPSQIYTIFNNRLKTPENNNEMNFDELRKRPAFRNCATDDDVLRMVGHLETEAGKVPGLNQEMQILREKNLVFENKAKEEEEAAKKKLLDDAEADGRINAVQRPHFVALLDADRANGEAVLNSLPKKKRAMENLHTPSTGEGPWDKRMTEIKTNLKQ